MPEPEHKLWLRIRGKQLLGVKFRRQCSIGKYIADFYSFKNKLVIEIDGDSHFESSKNQEYDHRRREYFNSLGIHVVRFTNDEIMKDLDACIEFVMQYLERNIPS